MQRAFIFDGDFSELGVDERVKLSQAGFRQTGQITARANPQIAAMREGWHVRITRGSDAKIYIVTGLLGLHDTDVNLQIMVRELA